MVLCADWLKHWLELEYTNTSHYVIESTFIIYAKIQSIRNLSEHIYLDLRTIKQKQILCSKIIKLNANNLRISWITQVVFRQI